MTQIPQFLTWNWIGHPALARGRLAATQRVDPAMVVMIRTRANPESMMATVRPTVASINGNVPIQSLKTADMWLGATLVQRRLTTLLLALFAGVAVILASIGCYGVFTYWVSCRRHEIAIRMAMGAGTIAILRSAALGLVLGLLGSGAASRWVSSLVFGVSAHDATVLSFAVLIAFLIVVLSTFRFRFGAPRNLIPSRHFTKHEDYERAIAAI